MKLGLLTGVIGNHERAEAFDICQKLGLDCVELGTGEFSSDWHVGLDEIVSDDSAVERLNSELAEHGLEISALSCHCNALHPNPEYAERALAVYKNTVIAPRSSAIAPNPIRCAEIRAVSQHMTRMAWPRGGNSHPINFSTASA